MHATSCILQAEELKAHSEKRMKELEQEIQECERSKVHLSIDLHMQWLLGFPVHMLSRVQDRTCMLTMDKFALAGGCCACHCR